MTELVYAFSTNDSHQKILNLGMMTKQERTLIADQCRKLKLRYKSEDINGDHINKNVIVSKPNGYVSKRRQKSHKDTQLQIQISDDQTINDLSTNVQSTLIEFKQDFSVAEAEVNTSTETKHLDKTTLISDHLVTDAVLKEFCSISGVPVAVPMKQYIVYYFDLLDSDPNFGFNAWKKFAAFHHELVAFSGYNKFASRNEKTTTDIADEVRRIVKDMPYKHYTKYTSVSRFASKNVNLYMRNNHGKHFVSIDIKSAWFTLFKSRYLPDDKISLSWEEFIDPYTKSQYVKTSKRIRETVFGRSGFQRIVKSDYRELQDPMLDFVDQYLKELGTGLQPYHLDNDELIFEVDQAFNCDDLKQKLDTMFPFMFHVKKFQLMELGSSGFYVKQHTSGIIEFKVCGAEFIAQCIKFFTNQPITEMDRQFANSNGVAIYRNSKFD